jgi:hypothetical protein
MPSQQEGMAAGRCNVGHHRLGVHFVDVQLIPARDDFYSIVPFRIEQGFGSNNRGPPQILQVLDTSKAAIATAFGRYTWTGGREL